MQNCMGRHCSRLVSCDTHFQLKLGALAAYLLRQGLLQVTLRPHKQRHRAIDLLNYSSPNIEAETQERIFSYILTFSTDWRQRSGRRAQPKPQPMELLQLVEKPPCLKLEWEKCLQHINGDVIFVVGQPRRQLHHFPSWRGPCIQCCDRAGLLAQEHAAPLASRLWSDQLLHLHDASFQALCEGLQTPWEVCALLLLWQHILNLDFLLNTITNLPLPPAEGQLPWGSLPFSTQGRRFPPSCFRKHQKYKVIV